jgi:hypothetical protein
MAAEAPSSLLEEEKSKQLTEGHKRLEGELHEVLSCCLSEGLELQQAL